MKYAVLLGRIFFALIFLVAAPSLFSSGTIQYAASQGVPLASFIVPLAGGIALLGGLSVALGFKAKWGARLLILFLVPVTLTMHNFWAVTDPAAAQMQTVMFMKNLSMTGGALLVAYFGAGPVSVDDWLAHRPASTAAAHRKATA